MFSVEMWMEVIVGSHVVFISVVAAGGLAGRGGEVVPRALCWAVSAGPEAQENSGRTGWATFPWSHTSKGLKWQMSAYVNFISKTKNLGEDPTPYLV